MATPGPRAGPRSSTSISLRASPTAAGLTDLPLGVYPNLGYYTESGWAFDRAIGGAEHAELAGEWRREGAQLIGGCCGVGPRHIAAAKEALAGTRPGRRPGASER